MKNDKEVWKPIPRFDGYEVSNTGKVRSFFKRVMNDNGVGCQWIISDDPQMMLYT